MCGVTMLPAPPSNLAVSFSASHSSAQNADEWATRRTNVLQGAVHMVLFLSYIVLIFNP